MFTYVSFNLGETDLNECESAPCQNKGICIDLIGRYQCRCTGTGFEGVNCKIFTNIFCPICFVYEF